MGNAAEWVGAIGTTLSVSAALWFYAHDRYLESTAQSRKVTFVQEGASYVITNNSEEPIYQVRLLYDPPRTFGDALAGNKNIYGVKYWNRHKEPFKNWTDQQIYDSFLKIQRYRWHDKWDRIDARGSVSYPSGRTDDSVPIDIQPYLAFADTRGRHWDLFVYADKPRKHNKLRVRFRTKLTAIRYNVECNLRARWRAHPIAANLDRNHDSLS